MKTEDYKKIELQKILDDKSIEYCFIKKRGYYYRADFSGYTDNKLEAGLYHKTIAIENIKGVGDAWIEPITNKDYNLLLDDEILRLLNKSVELQKKKLNV